MKNFREAVKRNQEKHEGLHVFPILKDTIPIEREPVDLVCCDRHGKVTLIRARGNGHGGKLNRMSIMRLQVLGKKCGARVLNSKVNGSNEICFDIIYERR